MKILIIGGSGFIGSNVADILSKKKYFVTIYDKKKSKFLKKNQKFIKGDLTQLYKLKKLIKLNDIIYNFAAISDIDVARNKPSETIEINIKGTINIVKLCIEHKIKRFIQASSVYADSSEGGFYAISKRAAEDYIQECNKIYGLKYTILRFGSLYGDRSEINNNINLILLNAKKNKKLIYRGSKKAKRKYINVEDAAHACLRVLNKKYENKTLTITGNVTVKIINILKFLSKNLNIKKITFLNEKNTSHYVTAPSNYKIRKSQVFKMKKYENIFDYLQRAIEYN